MNVVEKIDELRKAKNMTFREISQKSGVSAVTLSNWNSGRSKPQIVKLKKIADVLGYDFDELLICL